MLRHARMGFLSLDTLDMYWYMFNLYIYKVPSVTRPVIYLKLVYCYTCKCVSVLLCILLMLVLCCHSDNYRDKIFYLVSTVLWYFRLNRSFTLVS